MFVLNASHEYIINNEEYDRDLLEKTLKDDSVNIAHCFTARETRMIKSWEKVNSSIFVIIGPVRAYEDNF